MLPCYVANVINFKNIVKRMYEMFHTNVFFDNKKISIYKMFMETTHKQ